MPFQGIIHAVGPNSNDSEENRNMLISTLINSMKTANDNSYKTIAIPGVSTGIFAFPKNISAKCHIEAFIIYAAQFSLFNPNNLQTIAFVLINEDILEIFMASAYEKKDVFDTFHATGSTKEKYLSMFNSQCQNCHQIYTFEYFQVSSNCCMQFCDFCYFNDSQNKFCICGKTLAIGKLEKNARKCRICLRSYFMGQKCSCNS